MHDCVRAQVVWHKACRYFEIEAREANVSPDCLVMTAETARPLIDENTIGVSCMFASTYNGQYEDVKAIHDTVVSVHFICMFPSKIEREYVQASTSWHACNRQSHTWRTMPCAQHTCDGLA